MSVSSTSASAPAFDPLAANHTSDIVGRLVRFGYSLLSDPKSKYLVDRHDVVRAMYESGTWNATTENRLHDLVTAAYWRYPNEDLGQLTAGVMAAVVDALWRHTFEHDDKHSEDERHVREAEQKADAWRAEVMRLNEIVARYRWRDVGDERQRRAIPLATRRDVHERDGWRCLRCGDTERLTLDHVIPHAGGGSDEADNLQTLCLSCNSSKGATFTDYRVVERVAA